MPPAPLARLGLPLAGLALAAACLDGPPAVRCNSDLDCTNGEACTVGYCRPLPDDDDLDAGVLLDAGTPDAGEPSDAGFPDAGCPDGAHEGGAGCVPVGACSDGFARPFNDGDGDGVGAGAQADTCVALPLPAGLSLTGDDCDDGDAAVFALVDGFGDDDGDSFTTGPRTLCAGEVPPPALAAVERLGPVLLFEADAIAGAPGATNPWSNPNAASRCCGQPAVADIDATEGTAALLLSGFTCSATPERVDVVRVHVRARLQNASATEALGLSATLVADGVPGATRTVVPTWTGAPADLYVEGTAAEWGLAPAPEAACDGTLGVSIVIEPNGTYGQGVEVEFVALEIEGVADCAPDDGSRYARVDVFEDLDGDGARGTLVGPCHDDAPLVQPDARLRGPDCDDDDDRVFPGQDDSFAAPRPGGGFDYNCDGVETVVNVVDVTSCTDVPDAGTCDSTTRTLSGACGEEVDDDFCSSACELVQNTSPIRCR